MILICGVTENNEYPGLFNVALTDGEIKVICEGVKLWDTDAETLEDTFYEWLELAQSGEGGFRVEY